MVLFVSRTITFKDPPQESQLGPAFAKTDTQAFVMSRDRQFTFAPLTIHGRLTCKSFPHGGTWYKKPFQ